MELKCLLRFKNVLCENPELISSFLTWRPYLLLPTRRDPFVKMLCSFFSARPQEPPYETPRKGKRKRKVSCSNINILKVKDCHSFQVWCAVLKGKNRKVKSCHCYKSLRLQKTDVLRIRILCDVFILSAAKWELPIAKYLMFSSLQKLYRLESWIASSSSSLQRTTAPVHQAAVRNQKANF